jgi:hypothetical protein
LFLIRACAFRFMISSWLIVGGDAGHMLAGIAAA